MYVHAASFFVYNQNELPNAAGALLHIIGVQEVTQNIVNGVISYLQIFFCFEIDRANLILFIKYIFLEKSVTMWS